MVIIKGYDKTMNLQAIKYLAALAKYHHFGKAAAACFVSQPTLSMQIKKLEEELNVQLLERTNKSVRLTEIGAIMAKRALTILQEITHMQDEAKAMCDPYSGQIRLGFIPTLAPYILPHLIPNITTAFPNLKYYLVEMQTAILLEQLKCAEIDAAILALPILEKDLVVAPLFEEKFLLAVPANHPLAKRKTVSEKDLLNKDLLLLTEGHCLREQALDFCNHIGANEVKDFRGTSLETLRHMVSADMGITLMPKLACKKNDGVRYIPFDAKKPPLRKLGLVWRKTTPKNLLLKEMAMVIKKILTTIKST